MRTTSTILAGIVALSGVVSAQYQGFIFFKDDDECPQGNQDEAYTEFTNDGAGTSQCFENTFPVDDYSAFLTGTLIGLNTNAPTKFGACPTDACDSDCVTVDVTASGNGIRSDCVTVTEGAYIWIGF